MSTAPATLLRSILTSTTMAALLAACASTNPSSGPTSQPSAAPSSSAPTGPLATPAPTAAASSAASREPLAAFERNPAPYVEGAPYAISIDPADFIAGIDHPFLPFTPGTKFVFDGDEHVEVEVLPDRKVILGVAVTVVRDRVFEDGALIEDTFDWYAEDVDGNVWYFGEQTAEYENGKVTSTAGSWEAGIDGAQPGIVMLADPEEGDVYRQEFLATEAEDVARIVATSGEISGPAGSWSATEVLVTDEWTPLEPGVKERKTYAFGFGVVEIRTIEGGDEVTTLTQVTRPIAAAH